MCGARKPAWTMAPIIYPEKKLQHSDKQNKKTKKTCELLSHVTAQQQFIPRLELLFKRWMDGQIDNQIDRQTERVGQDIT